MTPPSINTIKRKTAKKSPYYFSRDTLNFFGQSMHMFRVEESPTGRIFIYSPIYHDHKIIGYSFREYTGDDLKLIHGRDDFPAGRPLAEWEIKKYIAAH